MMSAVSLPPTGPLDPVGVVLRHLREGEDVVRCAAARALAALGDSKAAPALVEALLDEDPDVRIDVMAALVQCARAEDADAIRRSLMGDPVKEVKVFAIEALGRLADGASVPLLCALAKDRCGHDVAWEDDTGMWDEWLDVQVAAIAALGAMGAGDAIETLLEARSDELGQELDAAVFNALAEISEGGVAVLAGLLRDRSAAVRAGAFRALSKARKDVLMPLSGLFAKDANAEIRQLAIGCLDAGDPLASRLALADPDAAVRRAGVAAFAASRPEIAQAALGDPDEEVKAIALEALVSGPEPLITDDLAANTTAWMASGGLRLATACATLLPAIAGLEAEGPLCEVAVDVQRPQELRIAALRSLGGFASDTTVEVLRRAATDPVRQVRAVALASLAVLSKAPENPMRPAAADLLIAAIDGRLSEPDPEARGADPEQQGVLGALGASKIEEGGAGRIVISRDGEILPADGPSGGGQEDAPESNVVEGRFPRSTLDAIQGPEPVSSEAEGEAAPDDAEDLAAGYTKSRRRRVAVDGPDDIGDDLRLIALGVAADCPGEGIEGALVESLGSGDSVLRIAAFKALAQRGESLPLSPATEAALVTALGDVEPVVRGYAAQAVAGCSADAADKLLAFLDDPDAIVRAVALRHAAATAPERAFDGLRDDSLLVRRAALESVIASGRAADLEKAMTICLEEGRADSLTEACRQSVAAHGILLSILNAEQTARRRTQAALEAIASA
ncbi:hypothetical protein HBA54_15085 [Pelagibius litoralis]|uniref:HEAT repeat n=1 Tax=Pelagibius litoralis TaxID=374515 RepID=A0A967EYS6_9PROT|nr:HEAT repeat domain-containing protein [Pelagibius litoralis]NIA69926.1 hypothetical protein [Pelagibius litoralis]